MQSNGCDCGIFVLKYAELLLHGPPPLPPPPPPRVRAQVEGGEGAEEVDAKDGDEGKAKKGKGKEKKTKRVPKPRHRLVPFDPLVHLPPSEHKDEARDRRELFGKAWFDAPEDIPRKRHEVRNLLASLARRAAMAEATVLGVEPKAVVL